MSEKKVIIIGGGITGLCTGVYLRKCGFDVEIDDRHPAIFEPEQARLLQPLQALVGILPRDA